MTPDEETRDLAKRAADHIRRADLEGLAEALRECEVELLVEGLRADVERFGASGFSRRGPSSAASRKGPS
jgi:acylphosphatase